jgi:hypothetical protein
MPSIDRLSIDRISRVLNTLSHTYKALNGVQCKLRKLCKLTLLYTIDMYCIQLICIVYNSCIHIHRLYTIDANCIQLLCIDSCQLALHPRPPAHVGMRRSVASRAMQRDPPQCGWGVAVLWGGISGRLIFDAMHRNAIDKKVRFGKKFSLRLNWQMSIPCARLSK